MYESKALGLRFKLDENKNIVFEDGVVYKKFEWVVLCGTPKNDLRIIHDLKKTFDGTVTHRRFVKTNLNDLLTDI